jgi:shikimate kinase
MSEEIVLPTFVRNAQAARAIALVGFMGAGKTTVGQALAHRLGWRFIDLDRLIESREGRRIEQIFQESGESFFRRIEHELLRESLDSLSIEPTVFALGGGAFAENAHCELLSSIKIPVVSLDAPVEELFRRCEQPGVVRPLRRNLEQFRELYDRRKPSYRTAVLQIDTGNKEIMSIVEEVITGLGLITASGVE